MEVFCEFTFSDWPTPIRSPWLCIYFLDGLDEIHEDIAVSSAPRDQQTECLEKEPAVSLSNTAMKHSKEESLKVLSLFLVFEQYTGSHVFVGYTH